MTHSFSRMMIAILTITIGSGSQHPESIQTIRSTKIGLAAKKFAKQDGFVGSVLVAEGNKTLVDQSFGFADLSSHVVNTPDSKFRIGSLTKQFTALLVLLLRQEEKIQLEEKVSKYLPEAPDAWRSITIRNLLEHTSGIPDFTDDARFAAWAMMPHTHREQIELFRTKALKFEPGTSFDYSNSNYILIGAVIEAITKQPYALELKNRILDPLHMQDSGMDGDGLQLTKRALGYRSFDGELALAQSESMSIPWSAGGMYSTTHDLLTYCRSLFTGGLLSPTSFKAMTTSRRSNYGLGLCVGSKKGSRAFWHDGGIEGFNSYLIYLPDQQIVIIALSNVDSNSADALSSQLLDLVLAK